MVGQFAAGVVAFGGVTAAIGGITTFENGTEGWSNAGRKTIQQTGNPGGAIDELLIDVFGADIRTDPNNAMVPDNFTNKGPIRFTVDIDIRSIQFFGQEVERDLVVELRDNTPSSQGAPWVSVWYKLGTLSADRPGWRTYSVDILNPNAAALPAGWGGTGAENPVTFEPELPADRTFADVLASVDEIHFTTFVPGFFFGFTNFDMAVDNVGWTAVPEPSVALLAGCGLLMALRRRS
jgi:hypothetical protein